MASPLEILREQATEADALHERSRSLLTRAVREGHRSGLGQVEIARAIGRSQPEVSRLLRFHGSSPLGLALRKKRKAVIAIARAHGATNLRVFGSVARGVDGPESDIDFLATFKPGTGLFEVARMESELSQLLEAKVDVVPSDSLRKNLAEQVLAEAVPL